MSPTVDVEIRRNRYGSVLAYVDRDRAARLLQDHRGVLLSLYDMVDRRHGADGEIVARLTIRSESRTVDDLEVRERFRRDLDADRMLSVVDDLRHHAGEGQLVTDGGEEIPPFVDPNAESVTCHFCSRTWEPTAVDGFDLSTADEYYPRMVPVCPEHAEGCR